MFSPYSIWWSPWRNYWKSYRNYGNNYYLISSWDFVVITVWLSFDYLRSHWTKLTLWPSIVGICTKYWFLISDEWSSIFFFNFEIIRIIWKNNISFNRQWNWLFGMESVDWDLVGYCVIASGSISRICNGETFHQIYKGHFFCTDSSTIHSVPFWKIGKSFQTTFPNCKY